MLWKRRGVVLPFGVRQTQRPTRATTSPTDAMADAKPVKKITVGIMGQTSRTASMDITEIPDIPSLRAAIVTKLRIDDKEAKTMRLLVESSHGRPVPLRALSQIHHDGHISIHIPSGCVLL